MPLTNPFSRLTKTRGAWLSGAVMAALVVYYFTPVVFEPLEYWMVIGGDATKNYFVPAYYAKYDTGLRFTAMNYPYDEHILFTDGHFPISWFMQLLQRAGFNASDYTVPVINYGLLLSLVLSAVFVFLLLFELGVSAGFAVAMGVGISLLSPQLQRFLGHFSMGYTCYLPMLVYFLHRQTISPKPWKWVLAAVIASVFFGLLHSYMVAIAASFLLAFAFTDALMQRARRSFRWQRLFTTLVSALAPIALIQLFVTLTDPDAAERVHVPWGFDAFFATWRSVFLPPMWNHFNYFEQPGGGEGYAYIGVVAWLGLTAFVVRQLVRFRIKRTGKFLLPSTNPFLLALLYAGFFVLLYSMQYPWRWNLRSLADEMPLVGQFRSLGRFAWPFYYAAGIFAAYFLYVVSRTGFMVPKPWLRYGMLITISALLFFDAQSNVKPVKRYYEMSRVAKDFWPNDELEHVIKKVGYSARDFQAVMELPFHHIGTEKFWIEGKHTSEQAMKVSYNTGLRIVNAHMARSPMFQSARIIQLTAGPLIEKEVLATLDKTKPVLLLVSDQNLRPNEQAIVSKAHYIASLNNLRFFVLHLDSLASNFDPVRVRYNALEPSLRLHRGVLSVDASDVLKYDPLEDTSAHFLTSGRYIDSGRVQLFHQRVRNAWIDTAGVALSCWFRIRPEIYGFPEVHVKYFDANKNQTEHWVVSAQQSQEPYKDWARLNFPIPPRNADSLSVYTLGRKYELARFMMQRPGSHVFTPKRTDSSFTYNNYLVPPPTR